MVNHSATYSMPDSGIDPDEVSVSSSVTDYLNQVGVKPNMVKIIPHCVISQNLHCFFKCTDWYFDDQPESPTDNIG